MSQRNGPAPGERMLKPSEAAARLGVTTETLYRWFRSGKLDRRQTPTGRGLYPAAAVEARLDALTAAGARQ